MKELRNEHQYEYRAYPTHVETEILTGKEKRRERRARERKRK